MTALPNDKPQLSFRSIWNMCFGFLGLQFGFALQNANVSRIFQTLGASLDQIPALWIAAPLTGLIVQPLIGYCSDRTWTRLGRRRPYFLVGAALAAGALFAMPRAPGLLVAALLLWVLDGSLNISMEPFRALVGDQLAPRQRPAGYAMQGFFIGLGAIVASAMPYILAQAGVSNAGSGPGMIPETVRLSFDVGAVVLLAAVGWTVLRTREYPPEQLHGFSDATPAGARAPVRVPTAGAGWWWTALGVAALLCVRYWQLDGQLYILAAGVLAWGLAQVLHANRRASTGAGVFHALMEDLEQMPPVMRQLIPVQFFSWLALFAMWIYTTPAVALRFFGSADPQALAYNEGANWVGVLFAAYNGFAALAAIVIPRMVRRFGLRRSHLANLWLGGAALASFLVLRDPHWLILPMVGIGFAWASILSLPYALLSDSVPTHKMGVYMGIFNFFIVIPQLVAASFLGLLLRLLFGGASVYALVLGGVSFILAGLLALRISTAES
jgi:maltose/moltooligosaccharide transporter